MNSLVRVDLYTSLTIIFIPLFQSYYSVNDSVDVFDMLMRYFSNYFRL